LAYSTTKAHFDIVLKGLSIWGKGYGNSCPNKHILINIKWISFEKLTDQNAKRIIGYNKIGG
jgi:hypothetical protein